MNNATIAETLDKIAFFLEMKAENPFKIRAYRSAARCVRDYEHQLEELLASGGDLTQVCGIGPVIARKVEDLIILGRITTLDRLVGEFPESLYDLNRIRGIGPKTILQLYQRHGISSLAQLRQAVQSDQKLDLPPAICGKIQAHFRS